MREEIFKVILICAGLGAGLLASAFKRHKRLRRVQDTPRSKVSSAAQGYAELQGYAWPNSGWMENSQGRAAVYYHFQLQKLVTKGSGKNKKKEWVTVFQTLHNLPFYLIDPTGVAKIDPSVVDLEIESTRTQKWRALEPGFRAKLLTDVIHNRPADFPPADGFFGSLFAASFRICESEILAGSPLHASGDFRSTAGTPEQISEHGLTAFANKVFDLNARTFRNLTRVFDQDKNGKLSIQEAKNGFAGMAAAFIRSKPTQEQTFGLHGTLKKSDQHPLCLSDSHEDLLIERLQKYLVLRFAGGGGLICASLLLTVFQFNPHLFDRQVQPAATREVASVEQAETLEFQSKALHKACQNKMEACLKLLEMKDQLQLDQKYLRYYKAKACELGHQDSCVGL